MLKTDQVKHQLLGRGNAPDEVSAKDTRGWAEQQASMSEGV